MLMRRTLSRADGIAVLLLIALWLLFFWRLFTPIESDQASLVDGDFSRQFVAFGGYQYKRFAAGEVPLWDPYNNGGLPFIADTQAAVFYPPRLVTIFLSKLAGGWSYHALELEMTAHVLAYSLMMYALVRRMTLGQAGSILGAFVAAIVGSYGGFLSAYPPLQLALLEAAIWLPLAALGVLEATRNTQIRWAWLVLTGFALGLSWMAGHPQTSWFLTYLLVAFCTYRFYTQKQGFRAFALGTLLFGAVAFGIAAVQLLPGVEYLALTARAGLGFDLKMGGFYFQDITQFIFPGIFGPWSPLYVGVTGLALGVIALWRKAADSLFWGIVALIALGMSFGGHSALFDALYNLLPGLRYFRGQERAAYLVANSLAILAGLGAAHLVTWDKLTDFKATRRIQWSLLAVTAVCAAVVAAALLKNLGTADAYTDAISKLTFSALAAALAWIAIGWLLGNPTQLQRQWLLAGVVVFELFTVNIHNSNYNSIPPQQQLSMHPPPLVATALADSNIPFRVDGYRGLQDNYGSLYGLADIRGISPLFLDSTYSLIEPDHVNPLAWELFAVRYIYSDSAQLPVPSTVIASGQDSYGAVNLYKLTEPRPFVLLMYDFAIVDSDAFARALLRDTNFTPRKTVILNRDPGIARSLTPPTTGSATVTEFKPEQFTIFVNTPNDAVLSVSNPDYPGWQATLDGSPTPILRAYGALSAVVVPSGDHTVRFVYDPLSYRVGALLSLFTWSAAVILAIVRLFRIRTET
jgi:hypothetical protein